MDKKEYEFFNRLAVALVLMVGVLFLFFSNGGHVICAQLEVTGQECKGCGLTRDFLSYLNFDFNTSINPHSFPLFICCCAQLMYRMYVGFVRPGYGAEKWLACIANRRLAGKQTQRTYTLQVDKIEKNNESIKIAKNLKTVMTVDIVITVFIILYIFLVFWV